MQSVTRHIIVDAKNTVSSAWLIPESYRSALIIAHGATQDMHSELITALHQGIAEYGILAVKFNFPYLEQGRKVPNVPSVLEDTWLAVIDAVISQTGLPRESIFLAGKSLGGRYATLLAAKMDGFAGVICYGFPLHAPGKPEKPRFEHLTAIHSPLLFFQGTHDSLCDIEIFKPIVAKLANDATLHPIEGGDHSFKILKRLNRSADSVYQEMTEITADWLKRHQFSARSR